MSDELVYRNPDTGLIYIATGDNANCTVSACPIEFSVYGYRPSLPFSITIIALYSVCAVVQLALGIRYKKWGFMAAMLLGCIDEILGYVGRIMYWQNPWGDIGFILQIVLITIGPVFFAAAIYVMIYQIALYISPSHSRFKPVLFYWIFIPCDIISLILQAVGGAMSSTSNGDSTAGVDIALAGLSIQVITLVFFVVMVLDYMYRSREVWMANKPPMRFQIFSGALGLATILILIRCCYRVYELSEGYSRDSEALRDEPLFNGLEGIMVVAAAWLLVVAHPGIAFKGDKTLTSEPVQKVEMYDSVSPVRE